MAVLDQEGTFQGEIMDMAILDAKDTQSKAVSITVRILEIWHEGAWHDWSEYGLEVSGNLWVIKKDGTINETQWRALVENAGWDGSFASVATKSWKPKPVQVVVQADTYKDQTRYRISWLNAWGSMPGILGGIAPDAAAALDAKYGAQARALSGNVNRGKGAAPAGKPGKPSAPKKKAESQPETPPLPPRDDPPPVDEIPF